MMCKIARLPKLKRQNIRMSTNSQKTSAWFKNLHVAEK